MAVTSLQLVTRAFEAVENACDTGVIDRLLTIVDHQILLADVGNIVAVGIFGEQVLKRLILRRTDRFRNRFVPFVAVGKNWIDVENHAAEIEMAVPDDIADVETRVRNRREFSIFGQGIVHVHCVNLRFIRANTSIEPAAGARHDLAKRATFANRASSISSR